MPSRFRSTRSMIVSDASIVPICRKDLKIIEKDANDTRLARQRRQFADVSLSCGVDAPQHDAIEKSMAFVNYLPFEMEQ